MNKIFAFLICFFCMNNICVAYEAQPVPVDTVALEEALRELTYSNSGSYNTACGTNVECIKSRIIDWVIIEKEIYMDSLLKFCINQSGKEEGCLAFIKTYNRYLNHANFCIEANNFDANGQPFSSCIAKRSNHEMCNKWVSLAENCSEYLVGYYEQKISDKKVSKVNKKIYECVLHKLETGNIEFPTSKMEDSCK